MSVAETMIKALDWARKLIIGDTRKQSLREIWTGDTLFKHQLAHLAGKRKENSTCAACGQLTHCLPDNIDPYANRLYEELLRTRNGG